jgi:hypothetical protein
MGFFHIFEQFIFGKIVWFVLTMHKLIGNIKQYPTLFLTFFNNIYL